MLFQICDATFLPKYFSLLYLLSMTIFNFTLRFFFFLKSSAESKLKIALWFWLFYKLEPTSDLNLIKRVSIHNIVLVDVIDSTIVLG